jgi:hypothetical protein
VVFAIVAAGCQPKPSAQARWLDQRGAERGTAACVRIAAALRAECAGDTTCEEQVSHEHAYHCYVAVYREEPELPPPQGTDLGPCFWEDGRAPIDCTQLGLAPDLVPHCEAEKKFAAEVLCKMGDGSLTGAGP